MQPDDVLQQDIAVYLKNALYARHLNKSADVEEIPKNGVTATHKVLRRMDSTREAKSHKRPFDMKLSKQQGRRAIHYTVRACPM